MRSNIAYYLLILYTIAMCKPVLPLVEDKIAHIFWKTDHIATVHHHHGENHAEHEVETATHEEENSKGAKASKTSEPVSIHLIIQSSLTIPHLFIEKPQFGEKIYQVSSLSVDKHYPPPRSC